MDEKLSEDPVVSRLITTAAPASGNQYQQQQYQHTGTTEAATSLFDDGNERERTAVDGLDDMRPEHIPDIASLFTGHVAVTSQARKDSVFDGLETREVLRPSVSRPVVSTASSSSSFSSEMKMEHRESPDYGDLAAETELPNNGLEDAHTIGPYDSVQDYVNDQYFRRNARKLRSCCQSPHRRRIFDVAVLVCGRALWQYATVSTCHWIISELRSFLVFLCPRPSSFFLHLYSKEICSPSSVRVCVRCVYLSAF